MIWATAVGACGGRAGRADETPSAALASTPEAQNEFRPLLKRFARGTRSERIVLEPELAQFGARHPRDPLARLAEAFRAWIALERGDLDQADERARRVEAGDTGTTRDFALVVQGAVLRRRGKPAAALEDLSPLVGKLIDPYARALLDEEIAQAALAARKWDRALGYLGVWLRDTEEDGGSGVKSRIGELITTVPAEELVRRLEATPGAAPTANAPRDTGAFRELMARRLAAVVRERGDASLARRVLASARSVLGDEGDAVARLASGTGTARVQARTVGIVLSLRSDETRRRGLDVAAGLAHGLALPGSAARLVSRDDGGVAANVEDALGALSAEGASLIVAGVDEPSATAAAAFAASHELPVILLFPPKRVPEGKGAGVVFTLGVGPADACRTLASALGSAGSSMLAAYGEGYDEPIDAGATNGPKKALLGSPCGDTAAWQAWPRLGVDGLLLTGDASCIDEGLQLARDGLPKARIGLGLDAPAAARAPGAYIATAGPFPFDARTTNASARAWMGSGRAPPSWWAALGHDAGVLAWAAIRTLPDRATEDPAEVRSRRATVAAGLRSVTAELWTSDAKGFGGAAALPRTVGARRVD